MMKNDKIGCFAIFYAPEFDFEPVFEFVVFCHGFFFCREQKTIRKQKTKNSKTGSKSNSRA